MVMRYVPVLLLATTVVCAHAAPARPLVPLYDAPAIVKACDDGLASAQAVIAAMEAKRGAGAIFDEWNRLSMLIEDVQGPVYLLGSVHPDKAVRDAAEPCLQKFTTLNTELFQSGKLLARVNAAKPRNAHQAKLRKDLLEGFEDAGATLPPRKRARAKEIFEKLETLPPGVRPQRARRPDPRHVHGRGDGRPSRRLSRSAQGRRAGRLRAGAGLPVVHPVPGERAQRRSPRALLPREAPRGRRSQPHAAAGDLRDCARSSPRSTACPRSRAIRCATRWSARPRRSTGSSRT
jgi:thimet oligopeptidase